MADIPVRDIMVRDVVSVPRSLPVRDVAALLHERRITGVPVVDDEGHVLGVVSELDLISRRGATAADIMSADVISVSESTGVDEVAHLFVNQRIRRVPVVEQGRLVGIVSRSDLLRPSTIGHFLPGDQNDITAETDQA